MHPYRVSLGGPLAGHASCARSGNVSAVISNPIKSMRGVMKRFRRSSLLPAAALAPLAIAATAFAQTTPGNDNDSPDMSEVIVTGTRLTAEGFVQPTPTTMLSNVDIEKSAHPNIFNTIVELPSLQGSTGRG